MNLDWDFYFDNWLIDRVPNGMDIKVEEHPSGIVLNPPELTCYFGANPIYLYGKGKLFHEVLMSPTGIAIYPEFLSRPGFEFVEEIKFDVSFEEKTDYYGRNVEDLHVGWVNALDYMQNISKNIYGVDTDQYVGVQTPSSRLRFLNSEDYALQQEGFSSYQMFADAQELIDNDCAMYLRMDIREDTVGPYDVVSGTNIRAVAPGAFITYPGTYSDVLFLKYTYVEVPQSVADVMTDTEFQILFATPGEFREGVLFDFGSTNISNGQNYGFRMDVTRTGVSIYLNDGDLNIYNFVFDIDFRVPHKWSISRSGSKLWIIVDSIMVGYKDDVDAGSVLYDPSLSNYISGRSSDTRINNETGDIEELAFFRSLIHEDFLSKYFDDYLPILRKGGTSVISYENIPISLSYELTYDKPTEFFIPNFFGGNIDKFYLVNASDQIQIVGGSATSESYIDGAEPIQNKSLIINQGYRFQAVTTLNFEDNVDFNIGEKIPVLTKLTSDTHIPLKIYMKFKIPDWHDKQVVYNIRLLLKSLDKFLWYTFEKYKTGEFV